jgi:transposase-like protein
MDVRRKFSREFKLEAVKMAKERAVAFNAQRLR